MQRKVSMLVMVVAPVLSLFVVMLLRSFLHKFTKEGLHSPIVSILKGKSYDRREDREYDNILKDEEPQFPGCR